MAVDPISNMRAAAIAKCIRNAEIPTEYVTPLVRDLCVLFKANNVDFDQKRFIAICAGMSYKDKGWTTMKEFNTIKYLDEVWDGINKRNLHNT